MKIIQKGLISRGLTTISAQSILLIVSMISTPGFGRAAQENPSSPASAPQKPDSATQSSSSGPGPAPMMEQQALDRLKRMSETLSAAKSFTVRSSSTVEVPAKTGQFVTLLGTSEVALERPNKVRVKVTGEVPNFEFFYDGTNMAAVAPQNNVYSIERAPGTIDEMLNGLEEKSGIHLPTADVMYSDPNAILTKDLTSAFVVGPATVDGSPCEHLAFMSRGVHWEVWVDTGQTAVPRYLVVTYPKEPNLPRFHVGFSNWNLQPNLAPDTFVFKPPPNARQIEFQTAGPAPTGRTEK